MSVLTGPEITRLRMRTKLHDEASERGDCVPYPPMLPRITIEPFNPELAGPNSYDVHLSPQMAVYRLGSVAMKHRELFQTEFTKSGAWEYVNWVDAEFAGYVDSKNPPPVQQFIIPEDGFIIYPGVLYLGSTVEHTKCEGLVPWLDGRSSVGRLGYTVHVTAGRGDDDWAGRWTLEIHAVAHPVKIYPFTRCGQITYFTLEGERKKYTGRYNNQTLPVGSRLHEEVPHLPSTIMTDTQRVETITLRIEQIPNIRPAFAIEWARQKAEKHGIQFVDALTNAYEILKSGKSLPPV